MSVCELGGGGFSQDSTKIEGIHLILSVRKVCFTQEGN